MARKPVFKLHTHMKDIPRIESIRILTGRIFGFEDRDLAGVGDGLHERRTVEDGDVYATPVAAVVMYEFIIRLLQGGIFQQPVEDIAVFHFREAYQIRKAAIFVLKPEYGLCHCVALGLETFLCPVPAAER